MFCLVLWKYLQKLPATVCYALPVYGSLACAYGCTLHSVHNRAWLIASSCTVMYIYIHLYTDGGLCSWPLILEESGRATRVQQWMQAQALQASRTSCRALLRPQVRRSTLIRSALLCSLQESLSMIHDMCIKCCMTAAFQSCNWTQCSA